MNMQTHRKIQINPKTFYVSKNSYKILLQYSQGSRNFHYGYGRNINLKTFKSTGVHPPTFLYSYIALVVNFSGPSGHYWISDLMKKLYSYRFFLGW